jgi:hypothetical protein
MTATKENYTTSQQPISPQNQVVTLQDLIDFKNELSWRSKNPSNKTPDSPLKNGSRPKRSRAY